MADGGTLGIKGSIVQTLWWRDLKKVWAIEGWNGNFEDNCSLCPSVILYAISR